MIRDFTPAYYSIKQDIKDKIAKGVHVPGELLPGRKDMCVQYNCSWSTLNRAVNELILEGVLTAEKGKGTYVSAGPSEAKRIESSSNSKTLNVWLCNPFPSVYAAMSDMMDGMRNEARKHGATIRFTDLVESESFPGEAEEYIVVTPSNDQLPSLIQAQQRGDRFVVLNSSWNDAPFACIDSDMYSAFAEATNFLLSNGHHHIGLLGIRDGFTSYERRVAAFRDTFERFSLPLGPDWIVGRCERSSEAKMVYSRWLDAHPEVTTLFAADYATTSILLELFSEKGIQIPGPLSLMSVGLQHQSFMQQVSLGSIIQPFQEMGRQAVSKLLERNLNSGTELLPCRLVIGGSLDN
jgi:GntR family transcriptional regulator of arabinose operon